MKLLPHQEKYASGYKDKAILAHEGGTGKTVCACVWLKDGRDSDALVVVPKRIFKKWQKALKDWGTKAQVISIENFKKEPPRQYSAMVIDEADEFASPLFTKGRSGRSDRLYEQVKKYPCPILLLTATPVRSTSWNLHSLLCFIGKYIDWKKWRDHFFYLQYPDYQKFRFLKRPAYMPIPEWRTEIRKLVEKHTDIVLLKDCVGYLPPVIEEIVPLKSTPFKSHALTPQTRFIEEHKHEQEVKPKKIMEIGKEYRKVLVVAYYVEQVEALAKALKKDGREVFMVHGQVKNQEEILQYANEKSDECYLVIQAGLGVGFDADSFSAIVYTSMSYKVRDFVQMKFRVRRIHNLHPVKYYYLIGGRCDKNVYEVIKAGRDFVPSEWSEK